MTRDNEPPRLRTLTNELPGELLLALRDTPAENATPSELAGLTQRLQRALQQTDERLTRPRRVARVPTARGRAAGIALTFTLGAAAGVLGSSGVLLVMRRSPPELRSSSLASARSPAPPARTASAPPQQSAAPEPPPDNAPPPANPATREVARLPSRDSAAELTSESSSRPASGAHDEFALLARAQAALAKNPGLALALASDHERKFPNGALVQEREVVAIDALLRLGRRAEASSRATRFHQQFPTSVHGRRLDVLLGNGGAAASDRD